MTLQASYHAAARLLLPRPMVQQQADTCQGSQQLTRAGCYLPLHGQEIQQLPYQHIIKWLPSKLRTKDPGPDDCFDVQVETTLGKKDLRMRCADADTVQTVISDIRSTVQVQHTGRHVAQVLGGMTWAPLHQQARRHSKHS
jgi:hypothetical protein